MLTPEQLDKHNTSITGSKIASILGISPFKSKYQLWAEMAGLAEVPQHSTERMEIGYFMEKMLHAYCEDKYGWRLFDGPKDGKAHAEHPFLWGLVDRLRDSDNGYDCIIEFKNIDGLQQKQWADGVPAYYEAQCRFYSMLYNLPCILVALFGGNHVEKYDIPRNDKVEAYLLKKSIEFWHDVRELQAPEPDGSESTSTVLAALYPTSSLDLIDGDGSVEEMILKREVFSSVEKRAAEKKEMYTNRIKQAMGEHQGIVCPSGVKATWKQVKDGVRFDEKSFADKHPDIYQQYLVPKPGYRRFLVSLPGKSKKALKAA